MLFLGASLVGRTTTPVEKAAWALDDMSVPDIQNTQNHQHMNERGEEGMGFSKTTTSHHFLLQITGGAIQVAIKGSKDTSRDHIHHHLAHIANAFAKGDFQITMFVHDATPPDVPKMKKMRQTIAYSFEETPDGGQAVIGTTNTQTLVAVHKFLRYQIEEH